MKQNALHTTFFVNHAANMPTHYHLYRLRFCLVPDSQYSNEEDGASEKLELKSARETFALMLGHMIDSAVQGAMPY